MQRLRYYTVAALAELREEIPHRLDWYYSPQERPHWTTPHGGVNTSRLTAPMLLDRLVVAEKDPFKTDVDNALTVSDALAKLTPYQATIERMWAFMCHYECPEYVSARWLHSRPSNDVDATRKVRNHFFAVGNRALIRDNGLSRLWWLGTIARTVEPANPRKFLEILLHRQDVRSALIERAALSMNRDVLSCIYRVMADHWNGDRMLFRRETFRRWMVSLNRRGGVILLDSLPRTTLLKLLKEEAEQAISTEESRS